MPQSARPKRLPFFAVATLFAFSFQVGSLNGQSDPAWGQKMFEVKDIDFGTVAAGSKPCVRVKLKNIYREDISITSLGQSFGCFGWKESLPPNAFPIVIASGREATLTLLADAVRFGGERKSKVTVYLRDSVHQAENVVEFPAKIHIRRDVVVRNSSFGEIESEKGAERTVEVLYAGNPNWQLTNVACANPQFDLTLREASRKETGIAYEIAVVLKPGAPQGQFNERIVITSNDATNPDFSISLDGNVLAADAVKK